MKTQLAILTILGFLGSLTVARAKEAKPTRPTVIRVSTINHRLLTEVSGIAASRRHPGVFWTHTDGGKRPTLHAISREGRSLAEFLVVGARIIDWEEVAMDDRQHVYVGDLGNNDTLRNQLAVYELNEPDPKTKQGTVAVQRSWQLRFPAAAFDCESLFIWGNHGYVVSKLFDDLKAEIYRFPLVNTNQPVLLEFVGKLEVTSPITGACISEDGNKLALVAKSGAYLLTIGGDPAKAAGQTPYRRNFRSGQIEGCCFVPEGLLASSEKRELFLFTDAPFLPKK